MTNYKKSTQNQSITFRDALLPVEDYDRYDDGNMIKGISLILGGMILGALLVWGLQSCNKPAPAKECTFCHNRQMAMKLYFEHNKNPTPDLMAQAVLKTNNAKLLAGIAVKGEKNTPYWIRNGGYKGRHAGSWQMSRLNEKAYGKVPYDPIGQALQAEKYLVDLTNSKLSLEKALSQFGGDSTSKYQRRVIAELTHIP